MRAVPRLLTRLAVSVPVAFAVFALGSGPALAECHYTRYSSGTAIERFGTTGHRAWANWNAGSRFLNISMQAQNMPTNYCVDSWFDWATAWGHYDARVARVCIDYRERYSNAGLGITEPVTSRRLLGLQKAAGCYYHLPTKTLTSCTHSPYNSSTSCRIRDSGAADVPSNCSRAWVVHANGAVVYYPGGVDPSSCSS